MSASTLLLPKWKEEPLSPITDENEVLFSEDTLYQTCIEKFEENHQHNDHIYCTAVTNNVKFEDDLVPDEIKEEITSYMLEDIEKLIDLDELIKEEYLLDEKILPILDQVEEPRAIRVPMSEIKMEYARAQDTHSLLKEFEAYVEYTHETLTPPQSPPNQSPPPVLTPLEPLLTPQQQTYAPIPSLQHVQIPVPENHQFLTHEYPLTSAATTPVVPPPITPSTAVIPPLEYPSIETPQPDIAHELAVVDELVRSTVEDMQWMSSPSSPNSNSCSGSSNFGDCSSDDPEWIPEPVDSYDESTGGPIRTSRKRSKVYSRGSHVDKKSRKKEQNKNAATRYRMKKKAEVEVILSEEKELSQKNDKLENQISDMQREIKYLKGLMRDLFKAKGLIN